MRVPAERAEDMVFGVTLQGELYREGKGEREREEGVVSLDEKKRTRVPPGPQNRSSRT